VDVGSSEEVEGGLRKKEGKGGKGEGGSLFYAWSCEAPATSSRAALFLSRLRSGSILGNDGLIVHVVPKLPQGAGEMRAEEVVMMV
jgi:hypothetical protein